MIGEPPAKYRQDSAKRIAGGTDFRHRRYRKMPFSDQIKWKPGQQKIADIVVAKLGNDGAPGGTLQQNIGVTGRNRLIQMNGGFRSGHPGKPRDEPAQAHESEKYEENAP